MAYKDPFDKVIAKAWKDPAFKKKLLQNPKAALQEMGVDTPPNVEVKIVENTPHTRYAILPEAPSRTPELNESELEKLAAGRSFLTMPGHCPV